MEQPKDHITKNTFHVPMCEWCIHFKRNANASPKSRFGVCTCHQSAKYSRTVPVSLPGCNFFSCDTPHFIIRKQIKVINEVM